MSCRVIVTVPELEWQLDWYGIKFRGLLVKAGVSMKPNKADSGFPGLTLQDRRQYFCASSRCDVAAGCCSAFLEVRRRNGSLHPVFCCDRCCCARYLALQES